MNYIIREAMEAYKLISEDMHDNVDDVDRAIKTIAALDDPPVPE